MLQVARLIRATVRSGLGLATLCDTNDFIPTLHLLAEMGGQRIYGDVIECCCEVLDSPLKDATKNRRASTSGSMRFEHDLSDTVMTFPPCYLNTSPLTALHKLHYMIEYRGR